MALDLKLQSDLAIKDYTLKLKKSLAAFDVDEALRWLSALKDEGCEVVLGLEGGYSEDLEPVQNWVDDIEENRQTNSEVSADIEFSMDSSEHDGNEPEKIHNQASVQYSSRYEPTERDSIQIEANVHSNSSYVATEPDI